jgi:short-subunit dehydrogenase
MKEWSVVTGAASGLGFEPARLLAADGYQLCLVDYDRDGLLRASIQLEQEFGIPAEMHVVDLGVPKAAEKLWAAIGHHRIEILVNNAGFGLYGFFSATDWKKEESMLHLHVLTLTHLTKIVLTQMLHEGSGKILNVASLAAFQPGPLMSIYYASKAYILSFTEAMANKLMATAPRIIPRRAMTSIIRRIQERLRK